MNKVIFHTIGSILLTLLLETSIKALAAESTLFADRIRETIEGVHCEYSPGQEALARGLALRVAQHQQQMSPATSTIVSPMLPLSVAELRARREVYLARIAQGLALSKPLATQEECYDVFADYFLTTNRSLAAAMESIVKVITSGRIAIWDRDDLARRLQAGGIVPGFSYDEETRMINMVWTGNSTESAAGESERRVSDSVREYTYSLRQSGQMIGYTASVTQSDNVAIASPTSDGRFSCDRVVTGVALRGDQRAHCIAGGATGGEIVCSGLRRPEGER